jgi:hypothetical protein
LGKSKRFFEKAAAVDAGGIGVVLPGTFWQVKRIYSFEGIYIYDQLNMKRRLRL